MTKYWRSAGDRQGFDWWGRCDLCGREGPAHQFLTLVRDWREIDVCDPRDQCLDERTWITFWRTGWSSPDAMGMEI